MQCVHEFQMCSEQKEATFCFQAVFKGSIMGCEKLAQLKRPDAPNGQHAPCKTAIRRGAFLLWAQDKPAR